MMTRLEAAKRALATFLQASVGMVAANLSGLSDLAVWKAAGISGLVALITYLHRIIQAALTKPSGAPLPDVGV